MPKLKIDGGNFELYEHGRFLTITGNVFNDSEINPVDAEIIKTIHNNLVPSTSNITLPINTKIAPVSDNDMLQVKSALQFINSNERSTWVNIGQILHRCNHANAFETWNTWSQQSELYDDKDALRVWNSFGKTTPANALTLGTLFYFATNNGWIQSKPNKAFKLTDLGNAERLVASCKDRVRFCMESKTWLIWNGRYWQPDADNGIYRMAKGVIRQIYVEASQADNEILRKALAAHATRSEGNDRMNAMVKMATRESGVPISVLKLDNNHLKLNVENGTIDLNTGSLSPHNINDFMTGALPFNFNPTAKAVKWEKFLKEIFNNDQTLIDYIQRAIGYTLTGLTLEQNMFFCYGKGANGKTTFLNIMAHLLGRHALRIPTELLKRSADASAKKPSRVRLKGARLALVGEVEEGQYMAESELKDLTGSDAITARFLFKEEFYFWPTHKLWQAGNHKPSIRGTDDGIWRRIHLIPFTQSFKGQSKIQDMEKQLLEELEGIFAWAVKGGLAWKKHGLDVPDVIKKAVQEYRNDQDIVAHFIKECIASTLDHDAKIADVY